MELRTNIIYLLLFSFTFSANAEFVSKSTTNPPALMNLNYQDLLENRMDLKKGKPEIVSSYNNLIIKANSILKIDPMKVIDGVLPPSGNKNDFFTIAKYAWPNTKTSDGMPYYTRDGMINPESAGDNYDLNRYDKTVFNISTLTLAWFYSEDDKYANKASELLRVWFNDPKTRMNPNFNCAGALPGVYNATPSGIIYGVALINMIDYVNILSMSNRWTTQDNELLKSWFKEYTDWLLTSEFGIKESKTTNNHSVWYSAQVATFAIYNGNIELAKSMIQKGKLQLSQQVADDGSLPRELGRKQSFHYSLYGIKPFCTLACCAHIIGEDLWNFQTSNGKSLKLALDFILPYIVKEKLWKWPNEGSYDSEDDRLNSISFIRTAAKALKTDKLINAENYIISISPKDFDKAWLQGRKTDSSKN